MKDPASDDINMKFQSFYEALMDGYARVDMAGIIVEANSAFANMLGYSMDELHRITYEKLTPSKWHALEQEILQEQVFVRGYSDVYEKEYCRKDGSIFPVELRTCVIRNDEAVPVGMWAIVRDITERKRVESVLRENEEKYRRIVDTAREGIWVLDAKGHTTFCNACMAEMLGYGVAELIGMNVTSFLFEEELQDHKCKMASRRRGVAEQYERRWRRKDGAAIWTIVSATPVSDAQGVFCGSFAMLSDITGRKMAEDQLKTALDELEVRVSDRTSQLAELNAKLQAEILERISYEKALKESEKMIRAVYDQTFQFIGLLSPDGVMLQVNKSAMEFADIREEDVIGKPFWDTPWWTHSFEMQAKLREAIVEANKGQFVRLEVTHPAADGNIHWIDFSLKPVKDQNDRVVFLVPEGRDITDSKKSADELRKSEAAYRTLFEGSRDAIIMIDHNGFFDCNQSALAMYRCPSKEQFVSKHPSEWAEKVQADGQDSLSFFNARIQAAYQEGGQFFEWMVRRMDGTLFPAEVLLGRIEFHGRTVLQAVVRDITERRRAEAEIRQAFADLKATQNQLLQSEKMASIGQLAAGVAHEINNPAGFVMSNLDVLTRYVDALKKVLARYADMEACVKEVGTEKSAQVLSDIGRLRGELGIEMILSDLPHLIGESIEGMGRIRRIVADLRGFAHSGSGNYEEADVHELIQSALNIAWNEIRFKAEVVKEYQNLPRIRCYPQHLSQVFLNILINAVQAISEKGKITIRTYMEGDTVVVDIIDTGCGMPDEVCKHIFEPFFTTKPVGEGTGLGLSLAYNIIENHKGKLSVVSRPGEGAIFTIRLPQGQ